MTGRLTCMVCFWMGIVQEVWHIQRNHSCSPGASARRLPCWGKPTKPSVLTLKVWWESGSSAEHVAIAYRVRCACVRISNTYKISDYMSYWHMIVIRRYMSRNSCQDPTHFCLLKAVQVLKGPWKFQLSPYEEVRNLSSMPLYQVGMQYAKCWSHQCYHDQRATSGGMFVVVPGFFYCGKQRVQMAQRLCKDQIIAGHLRALSLSLSANPENPCHAFHHRYTQAVLLNLDQSGGLRWTLVSGGALPLLETHRFYWGDIWMSFKDTNSGWMIFTSFFIKWHWGMFPQEGSKFCKLKSSNTLRCHYDIQVFYHSSFGQVLVKYMPMNSPWW